VEDALALLHWYAEAGVDDAMEDAAVNYFTLAEMETKPIRKPAAPAPSVSTEALYASADAAKPAAPRSTAPAYATKATASIVAEATKIAAECTSIDDLRKAVEAFDGCPLKKLASKTVFADGTATADIMFIGEAPGEEEDRQGIPFCGESGQLLDRMIGAIGLSRKENAYISNAVFWRPPGNRNPNPDELEICRPFVEKHIALAKPKLLVLVGGVAAKSLLGTTEGITRLRARSHHYHNDLLEQPVPTFALFHPSYLLRQPAHKAMAWKGLLTIKQHLKEHS
jgi:uracil-DNA glycosylase